jgi:16S rRNA processing protein RimM
MRENASESTPRAKVCAPNLRRAGRPTVEVGAVIDAYGLKGGLKIAPHAEAAGAHRGEALVVPQGPRASHAAFRGARERKVHGDSVVGQLNAIADRDAALQLRGARIYVSRADFPAPETDEYYWVDLIGLDVANEAGVDLGKVAGLIDNGAQSVLRVEYPSAGKTASLSPASG